MARFDISVARVRNAHSCSNLTKDGGLEDFITLASQEPGCGAILILMDADKECPLTLARDFSQRIESAGSKYPVVTVIANREYEAWFLASLETISGHDLDGRPGLPTTAVYEDNDVETLVSVKGWLTRQFIGSRSYKETLDQAIMTRYLDPDLVEPRSRSFRRLMHAVEEAVAAIDSKQTVFTPAVPSAVISPAQETPQIKSNRKLKRANKPHNL